ncbi:hypothetical protein RJ639_045860 [Escallonia herrerae]|uniref:Alpha-taxilin n=1 Tax=Escallonia herrerae TaxID=1293975 RepID=A0AA88W702_9ASTE|nr:hypothetical protein RJ639_045860 [Escallonia herrerae]
MENPAANQLPEADSLPDGFVNSSAEPPAPSAPVPEPENEVTDYKEEKLLEQPELVVSQSQSSEGTTGDGTEDAGRDNGCLDTGMEERMGGSPDGEGQVKATSSHSSEQLIEGDVVPQAAHVKGISSGESSGNTRKVETSEVKRKSAKRTFKSEKEFLEFTLKYQQVLGERDAAIALRDKLESLCRELQRQNKMLMDECKRVSTEGQNLRSDLSAKFQDAIKEVSHKLEEQKDDCLTQLKENEMLKIKSKHLTDQYALTEQQYAQKLKQKTLELQIADIKIRQNEEKLVQEQSQMKLYAEQVSQLLATEKNLQLQLTADGEKFEQFQDALLKSNEVFETFKKEIEKMTKSMKELKKENTFLKSKSEKSDITLIELVEEREHLKKQLEKIKNQKEKLESLCRSLQVERKQNSVGQNSSDAVPI